MKKGISLIVLLISFSLLAACSETSHEPVDISLDSDQCFTCHMGVEDSQSATQSILTDGTPRIFDDVGCMLAYLQETNDEVAISYVIDYDSGEWLDITEATFVHDQSIQTPMSYGFIAFSTEEAANQYIEENGHGERLSSEEVTAIDNASLDEWYKGHEAEHHNH